MSTIQRTPISLPQYYRSTRMKSSSQPSIPACRHRLFRPTYDIKLPLTYHGAEKEDFVSVRPAAFLQRGFNITLPLHSMLKFADGDAEYLPPEEIRILKLRQEVVAALQESCHAAEKFWTIWRNPYLTNLRETHKKLLTNQRYSQATP
ncbi:unnamed protein product [Heligmosomoides polygyrus]|uniref:DUF4238 domain-containing protein n=1 Tax=Heligmosomoides polygyrus TaxID=6339 RepID=A0A183GRY7_HELPZ|nr:unnamed protein product [Heligmosomoides polygyrus]